MTAPRIYRSQRGLNITGTIAPAAVAYPHSILLHLIDVHDSTVDVDITGQPNGGGFNGYGVKVEGCTGLKLRIRGRQLNKGVVIGGSSDIVLADSDFDLMQRDGVQFGTSKGLTFERIWFGEFRPQTGDHADAIQGIGGGSDIIIRDNCVSTVNPIQGAFLSDPGTIGYQRVTIGGNLIFAPHPNGIVVDGGTGVALSGNTILSPEGHPYRPQIRGGAGTNVVRVATAGEIEAARLAWLKRFRRSPLQQIASELSVWLAEGVRLRDRVAALT